jgi:hypothetical protein
MIFRKFALGSGMMIAATLHRCTKAKPFWPRDLDRSADNLICAALHTHPDRRSANQRANHFPKDVRCIRNDEQTILPVGANHFGDGANHFASWRKPFLREGPSPYRTLGAWQEINLA